MVNNIKNNTIREIDTKKDLNALNKIQDVEIIKHKKRTSGHKKILNLFNDLLDINLTDKILKSRSQENENENEDEYENEDDDDETIDQKEIIKALNDNLDEIIDKSKSFENQIESLEKVENLEDYYFINNFDDKELRFKMFKLKLAHLSNIIEKKLFETIFGHRLIKLADKLINTTNKEENQIIVKNINSNKNKRLEKDDFNDWVIQPNDQRINLKDAVDLILVFNEDQLDLV